jgi:hypothetical protein
MLQRLAAALAFAAKRATVDSYGGRARMRRCPACKKWLGRSFVFEMKHVMRFLCPRCWATVHLDPAQFIACTLGGALFGAGLLVSVALAWHVPLTRLGQTWLLIVGLASIAGRFLPRLEVEDPPLQ